jgi:hypothetical protein
MGMGTATPTGMVTSKANKALGIAKGTPYRTTPLKSDAFNAVRTGSYNTPPKNTREIYDYMSKKNKPMMKKGGSFPDLNKDGKVTKADILMGRGVINKPKAQKGMNIKKETLKNATPSIPNSYYQMGGMKEENPLSGMLKESMKQKAMAKKKAMTKGKPMPKAKKKMGMGGGPPNAFGIGIQPLIATEGKNFVNEQSFKKGGMIKKKKK